MLYRISSIVCFAVLLHRAAGAQSADPPSYQATHQVSGAIHTWGSPQMGDLLRRYEDGFHKVQPSVKFLDDLKSTVTAVAGVYTGRADIGLLGREIWPIEVQAFESVEGHPPLVLEVATGSFDVPKATFALMIFVPKSNPIASLSTQQLEHIFGNLETPPEGKPMWTWGDVGLKGAWATRPIHLYGFNVDNDKSQIFSRLIFKKDERWNCGLREFSNGLGPSGADAGDLIVQAVAEDADGIGISNVHYATPEVKALAISTHNNGAPIAPTRESVAAKSYPLTRAVYMVLNSDPIHPPSAAMIEFLRFVLSRQGQEAVRQEGNYLPLTADVAARQLRELAALPK
jgi:phosphate transport system substrate-binding protein